MGRKSSPVHTMNTFDVEGPDAARGWAGELVEEIISKHHDPWEEFKTQRSAKLLHSFPVTIARDYVGYPSDSAPWSRTISCWTKALRVSISVTFSFSAVTSPWRCLIEC